MQTISVLGGRLLKGEVRIHGGKNAVLPILAATIVAKDTCTIHNCPDIRDVETALEILEHLGCQVHRQADTVTVNTSTLSTTTLSPELSEKMRSSVLFLGALTAAWGEGTVYSPGGCILGKRPIDLHISGLQRLGGQIVVEENRITCKAPRLRGGPVVLTYPSVGATENLMLAAMAAEEPVLLLGVAKEPEIVDLAGFLKACGGHIFGEGTSVMQIFGGRLHQAEYTVMPDRMEAATYLSAAASAGGSVTLTHMNPCHIKPVSAVLRAAGCGMVAYDDALHIEGGRLHAPAPIITGPYPAFPTDAQATVMAALLRAEGTTVFEENVFENRYRHADQLRRLGADIRVAGRIASVRGVERLTGAEMEATDLRGGAAMLVAALATQGESRITQIHHMQRGYEAMPKTLCSLGADVRLQDER